MYNNREVYVFDNDAKLFGFLINTWSQICVNAVESKDYAAVALSGGRTPGAFYRALSKTKKVEWPKVHIFMADERFLSLDSEESNYYLIKKSLVDNIYIPHGNLHPVLTEGGEPDYAAERYEADLRSFFRLKGNKLPRFDLIMLGIGEDGHTASLFPGMPDLAEDKRLAIAVTAEGVRCERITLSIPVINNARNIIFLITGRRKAKVLNDILVDGVKDLPASLVEPKDGRLCFLLDNEAAFEISYNRRVNRL